MKTKLIYFVAGEASADNHGAALMRALRDLDPGIQFCGRGGPQMQAIAGPGFEDWIADAAVLGLWEVIKKYGYFREKFRRTIADIERLNPDAVLLIDYPGFNLRLARALHRGTKSHKIIYYISPQVWAWHRGRIPQMARWIDLMLCIFPFEADLYNQSGLRTRFVGHPMIDRLAASKVTMTRDPNLVALFPGSREREIRKIFPILMQVIRLLHERRPQLRFEVAAASEQLASAMHKAARGERLSQIEIRLGDSAGLMQRAAVGLVASGSATLEAAYFRLPFVLIYKVAWLTYVAAKMVVRVPHIGMPNVLAGREIVPEFIQHHANPERVADSLLSLMEDESKKRRMLMEFDAIMERLGEGGASEVAAREIVSELNGANVVRNEVEKIPG
ncbi:MAG TPA: lipid-A-disaccharide synthase [Chthoniobacterales bacterium]|nr:lipid-A-disaccharide synthase [Chthoniobacterales bacterium]